MTFRFLRFGDFCEVWDLAGGGDEGGLAVVDELFQWEEYLVAEELCYHIRSGQGNHLDQEWAELAGNSPLSDEVLGVHVSPRGAWRRACS